MWTSKSVTAKEERLLWKLESVIDLFKKFQDSADEEDKLTILEALGDIREILTKSHITKPLRRKEIADIEMVLKDLNSHVKAIALDDLFDEVNELKLRMDVVEKRWEVEKTEEFSKTFLYDEGEIFVSVKSTYVLNCSRPSLSWPLLGVTLRERALQFLRSLICDGKFHRFGGVTTGGSLDCTYFHHLPAWVRYPLSYDI